MADNEEPQATQQANEQIASAGHKLPEQSRLPECVMPRSFGFEHLIHQWQPMGIRVVLNTPFTGNDSDFLFAIRNGPFIPRMDYYYETSRVEADPKEGTELPDYTKRHNTDTINADSYAFNNMRNVIHAGALYKTVKPGDNAIYITTYDQPPILASLATMFRKWRGTMHYRIRVVSGFTTQGYVFASLIRNSPAVVGIYDTATTVGGVSREDESYREAMINSYVMGDTAMFRHFELQVPFEYPVPFYDQFNWIGNRTNPANNFMASYKDGLINEIQRLRNIRNEPHGDNYLLLGLRGKFESSVQNSQITFELEYRAGDDFQFSDPFLPFDEHYLFSQYEQNQKPIRILTVPSEEFSTDGIGPYTVTKSKTLTNQTAFSAVIPKARVPPAVQRSDALKAQQRDNIRPRVPRSVLEQGDEGVDEVDDDLCSEVGDPPELLDFKRNMRKSLRNF
nr:MAG: putative capsid protein 3 [Polycipiviridae sp.]